MKPRYVVITPVRNEDRHFEQTAQSLLRQDVLPLKWIIVDDGSTDQTGAIADAYAAQHAWIEVVHRRDRGFRQPGTGVIQAFYDGFARLEGMNWDYLVKLDGDLGFDPAYFADCFRMFDLQPRLGIGGGTVYQLEGGRLQPNDNKSAFHVRGATKIYRKQCWDQIGGLLVAPGWDSLDELKANMLGWETRSFPELHVTQFKPTGSADGAWRDAFKNGLANYITGYHPAFMLFKCAKRLFQKPYLVYGAGLFFGYCSGYWNRVDKVKDKMLIRYVRRQQLRRLLLQRSLWR